MSFGQLGAGFGSLGLGAAGSPALYIRGMGQGMSPAVQGFVNSTIRSQTTRSPHRSPVRFKRSKVVLQVFYPAGTPIVDTLFTGNSADLRFQVAFEASFTNALTGIPSGRPLFTFSGANYVRYDNATWDVATGYIVSDWMDHGGWIAANQKFGFWTTIEVPASTASQWCPYQRNSSSNIQRYGGLITSTSSQIANYGGASDVASTATSVTGFSSSQTGASAFFAPCMMIIETDSAAQCVFALGDSKCYGVGEGVAGSSTEGDTLGNANGDVGYVARGLAALGLNYINFGRGSDGNKYLYNPDNWKYRRQLMVLANPTHIINQNVFNDMAQTINFSTWAATTSYAKHDVRSSGGIFYYCTVAGTSGSTALSSISTTQGATITDGSCQWYVMGGSLGGSAQNGAYQVMAWLASIYETIRGVLPNVPIIQALSDFATTSTDSWATTANQSISLGFAVNASRRHSTNTLLNASYPLLGTYRKFDPSALIEDQYPTQTAKWVVNGASNYLTADGTHPNSVGAELQKGCITSDLFA